MKKRFWIVLVSSAFLTACLGEKDGSRIKFPKAQEQALQRQCLDMRRQGDYFEVKRRFDRGISELLELSKDEPKRALKRAEVLVKQIEKDAERLRELARPEWNSELWPVEYGWDLVPEDFDCYGINKRGDGFRIRAIEVVDSRVYGRPFGPPATIKTKVHKRMATVRMKIPSTTFELCEMSRSIGILLKVRYECYGFRGDKDFVLKLDEPGVHK